MSEQFEPMTDEELDKLEIKSLARTRPLVDHIRRAQAALEESEESK